MYKTKLLFIITAVLLLAACNPVRLQFAAQPATAVPSPEDALVALAADPALGDALAAGDQATALAMFQALVNAYPAVFAVEYVDANGLNQFGSPPDHSLAPYDFNTLANPGDDEFLAAIKFLAASEQQAAISLEVPMVEGSEGYFFLTPVYQGDEYLGVIYLVQEESLP